MNPLSGIKTVVITAGALALAFLLSLALLGLTTLFSLGAV